MLQTSLPLLPWNARLPAKQQAPNPLLSSSCASRPVKWNGLLIFVSLPANAFSITALSRIEEKHYLLTLLPFRWRSKQFRGQVCLALSSVVALFPTSSTGVGEVFIPQTTPENCIKWWWCCKCSRRQNISAAPRGQNTVNALFYIASLLP